MPYRRKPRSQRKNDQSKVPEHVVNKYSPEKRSLIKFGIIPKSVTNPETHQPLTIKLASSSKKERDNGISMVESILSNKKCAQKMDKNSMIQLWKALFYSFWMSDKVLIQHELARKLSNFIKICGSNDISLLYIECFMECIEREWIGIDYLRMSKFLSLIRYFIHSSFDYFALNEWDLHLIQNFSNILRFKISLSSSSNRGLFFHLTDIYIDELIKINRIDCDDHLVKRFRPPISFDALYNLLTPFISIYLESNKMYQSQYVIHKVFYKLLESMSFDKKQRELKNNHRYLLFEKKNFDVVIPFKEFEAKNDKIKIKKWEIAYGNSSIKREYDPLLMRDKMEEFRKLFYYLSQHKNTPNKARKKLNALSKLFVIKENCNKYYHRDAIKTALKIVDKTKMIKKWNKMKKDKKKAMRNIMKQQRKWNKMKKKGIKIKATNRLLKRAKHLIV